MYFAIIRDRLNIRTQLTFLHGNIYAADRVAILLKDLINWIIVVKLHEAEARMRTKLRVKVESLQISYS